MFFDRISDQKIMRPTRHLCRNRGGGANPERLVAPAANTVGRIAAVLSPTHKMCVSSDAHVTDRCDDASPDLRVGPQCDRAPCHPSDRRNLEVTPGFFKNT